MATQRVRRLDASNDSTYGKGRHNYASASESTEQRVLCFLRLFGGEWFLDTGRGIPWIQPDGSDVQGILGSKPGNLSFVETPVREGILGIEGVASIESFSMALDTTTRHLTIDAVIIDDDGNPIVLQQFDPLAVP